MNSGAACANSVVTHEGAVLTTFERNGYDDSDFCAIVWADGDFKTVTYASTRGWTYHNSAVVDATDEVKAAAQARLAQTLADRAVAAATAEAAVVEVGVTVKSTTTRGKNVGVQGKVRWHGVDNYKSTRWSTHYRVGVEVAGEEKLRFLPETSVEVVGPAGVDIEAVVRAAVARAAGQNWRVDA